MILKIIKFGLIFSLGVISSFLVMFLTNSEIPYSYGFFGQETSAPQDWISEDDIAVYNDKVVIFLKNPSLSKYAWSGSMKPVIDGDANGIRIAPESPDQISVGDIVTFKQGNALIVHRVIEKGIDEQGVYFITKGDNNDLSDGKLRFEDIKYVTVAIVY